MKIEDAFKVSLTYKALVGDTSRNRYEAVKPLPIQLRPAWKGKCAAVAAYVSYRTLALDRVVLAEWIISTGWLKHNPDSVVNHYQHWISADMHRLTEADDWEPFNLADVAKFQL